MRASLDVTNKLGNQLRRDSVLPGELISGQVSLLIGVHDIEDLRYIKLCELTLLVLLGWVRVLLHYGSQLLLREALIITLSR